MRLLLAEEVDDRARGGEGRLGNLRHLREGEVGSGTGRAHEPGRAGLDIGEAVCGDFAA